MSQQSISIYIQTGVIATCIPALFSNNIQSKQIIRSIDSWNYTRASYAECLYNSNHIYGVSLYQQSYILSTLTIAVLYTECPYNSNIYTYGVSLPKEREYKRDREHDCDNTGDPHGCLHFVLADVIHHSLHPTATTRRGAIL